MAKENPDTKPKAETPFRRFQRLTKRLIAVPKREADKQHQNYERDKTK